jgi:hypothetical protein
VAQIQWKCLWCTQSIVRVQPCAPARGETLTQFVHVCVDPKKTGMKFIKEPTVSSSAHYFLRCVKKVKECSSPGPSVTTCCFQVDRCLLIQADSSSEGDFEEPQPGNPQCLKKLAGILAACGRGAHCGTKTVFQFCEESDSRHLLRHNIKPASARAEP